MNARRIDTRAVMIRAWAIARTLVGDLAARLSCGLKQAWAELYPRKTVAQKIAEVGGKGWVHPRTGAVRMYFNRAALTLLNIEVGYHKTGNLAFFSINGHQTSNCAGKQYLKSLNKAYWDGERVVCEDADFTEMLEDAVKAL